MKMNRIYHTWEKWECFPAGFYDNKAPNNMTKEEAEKTYYAFLTDLSLFESILKKVIKKWKHSCEHYLTNENMNRIAWLGQACLAYKYNIPACYRGGYNQLSDIEKQKADELALKYLNRWLKRNGYKKLTKETVKSKTQANIY